MRVWLMAPAWGMMPWATSNSNWVAACWRAKIMRLRHRTHCFMRATKITEISSRRHGRGSGPSDCARSQKPVLLAANSEIAAAGAEAGSAGAAGLGNDGTVTASSGGSASKLPSSALILFRLATHQL